MQTNENKQENEHTYDNGFRPKEFVIKPSFVFFRKSLYFKIVHFFTLLFTYLWLFIPKRLIQYKVTGKKNLKGKKGVLMVCNHVYPLDAMLMLSTMKKITYLPMLQTNMGFGIVSRYFYNGGATPIPTDANMLKKFNKDLVETLKSGRNVMIYPEAALVPFCDHVRPFKSGAFHYAYQAGCEIIPCVTTFHKPKGLIKLFGRKKPCVHWNVLPAYKIEDLGNKRLTMEKAANDIHDIMSDFFNKNSDYFEAEK